MKSVAIVLLFIIPLVSNGQRFGGTPPNVKWRQIDTDSARIIYPSGLDSIAQRVATLVHYQAATKPAKLGDAIHKVNIVLQNQTTIANGYVGLGPFRSEFYLTPAPDNFDLGTLPWADQLAIHEYRHVEQFNNFRNGLSNTMRVLFGEEGYALAINASIPDWFYEGDAVYNETVVSKQGRGRLPLFLNAYPSLYRAGKNYKWMKLRNGSFKDYVPSHYNLGYLLVNYGREKYGVDFWEKVTKDASAFKGLLYPFQRAIRKHAKVINYRTFLLMALKYYNDSSFAKASEDKQTTPYPVFPVDKQVVTNYLFPYSISNDSTIYLKTSYDKRPRFIVKDKDGEHPVRFKDIAINDQFSYRNGKMVYAAYENDARWRWRDYSVIKLYDIRNGNYHTITHKSKYFTPDISPDGNTIVAVQNSLDGKSELHLLDASNGNVTKRIQSNEVGVFTDPKFISTDSLVTGVRYKDGSMALVIIELSSDKISPLTARSHNVVGYPCFDGGKVYFTASYGGSDHIYSIGLRDGLLNRLTDWSLGNYYVNVANGKMSWSAFTADGYQLQQADLASLTPIPVAPGETKLLQPQFPVAHGNEIDDIVSGNIPSRRFAAKRYSKGTRLINFHSWRPYYEDPEFTFSIYGQNVLNTLETQLYYLYNENDKTHAAGVSATYGGLFPYINVGSLYTFNRQALASDNRLKQWDQLDSRIGLSIPLSWVSGQTTKQLTFGSNYAFRQDFNKGFFKDTFSTINFSYLNHFINFSQTVETARQHFYPRLGYTLGANYRHVLNKYDSWQFLGNAGVYLPGILPTHNLFFTGGFQQTDTLFQVFGNSMAYSRGYNAAYFSRIWRLSANYHLPIVYPDWGAWNILYFQRVRGNAFFDFTRVYSNDKLLNADQRSFGGELFFDTKWWNQYELTFGFRVSRLMDRDFYTGRSGVTVFEFIMPVSIIPR